MFSRDGSRKAWLVPSDKPGSAPELHIAEANGKVLMTVKFRKRSVARSSNVQPSRAGGRQGGRSGAGRRGGGPDGAFERFAGLMHFQDNGSVLVGRFTFDCEDAKAMNTVAWDVNSGEKLLPKLADSNPKLRTVFVGPRDGSNYALISIHSEPGDRFGINTMKGHFDQLHVGNLKTGKVQQFSTNQKIGVVAFSNDGSLLAISLVSDSQSDSQSDASNESLAVYRVSDLVRVESFAITGHVKFVSFSEDNQHVAVAKHDHTIEVWERKTQTRRFTHSGERYFLSPYLSSVPLFSPDGRRLLVFRMKLLQVFDAVSGQLMLEDDLGDMVMSFLGDSDPNRFIDSGNRVKLSTLRGTRILDATPVEDQIDRGNRVE